MEILEAKERTDPRPLWPPAAGIDLIRALDACILVALVCFLSSALMLAKIILG